MEYKTVKLGDYIELVPQSGGQGLGLDRIRGISIEKKVIATKANMSGVDISGYNVVGSGEFVYATNTARMGDKIAVAYNHDEPILVSKIYVVFRIKDKSKIDSKYLYLFYARREFDRYTRYNSWGSVRETFDWRDMCDIEFPLPPIEKQREYVAIYGNLQKLNNNHEKSFADLQNITNAFTEKLVEKYGTQKLSDYITAVDERNYELGSEDIKGISIQKKFIVSKANMEGVSLASYKVVRPSHFGYVTVTSRNGKKLSIALNSDEIPYVVSSTYQTFKVSDESKLIPEFLLLWFKRPEFDRYARFNSWGSARETFDWSEMQRVRIPIPPLGVQKSIVAIHHALESRKRLTEGLKKIIKEISPVLIKNAKDKVLEVAA